MIPRRIDWETEMDIALAGGGSLVRVRSSGDAHTHAHITLAIAARSPIRGKRLSFERVFTLTDFLEFHIRSNSREMEVQAP